MQEVYYPEEYPNPPQAMPGQRSDEVYSAIIQEKRMENILDQLNPDRLIVDIEYRLKGYKKNKFTGSWELIGKKEIAVSDELVSDILSVLSGYLANGTTLSNVTPDEINRIMKLLIREIIDMMREKSEAYGIRTNFAERRRICMITFGTIFLALKRAQGGIESKRLFDALNLTESNSGMLQQPKKGFFGKLLNI